MITIDGVHERDSLGSPNVPYGEPTIEGTVWADEHVNFYYDRTGAAHGAAIPGARNIDLSGNDLEIFSRGIGHSTPHPAMDDYLMEKKMFDRMTLPDRIIDLLK